MRIAVLCPGPSLPRTFKHDQPYDVLIGVNRAVLFTSCDWLASFDASTVKALATPGMKVFTRASCLPQDETLEAVAVWYPCVKLSDAGMFTACGALLLAAALGANDIDVYGADWSDAPDFDGRHSEGDWRVAERWRRERVVWDKITRVLASQGIHVDRK